jgi:hypothetical protein
MHHLALRERIMPTVIARPGPLPPTELFDGLFGDAEDLFEEPYAP